MSAWAEVLPDTAHGVLAPGPTHHTSGVGAWEMNKKHEESGRNSVVLRVSAGLA